MAEDPLVTTDWLESRLGDDRIRVVDMRGYVITRQAEPGVEEATYKGAPEEYLAGHVPGAVYVDWTRDIVDPDDPVPAQLAGPDRFAEAMAGLGIGDDTHVVALDHVGGQFSTRLWWALMAYGHDSASILDGGWGRWIEEGRPIESGPVTRPRAHFTPRFRPSWRKTADEVLASIGRPEIGLLDARDEGQFTASRRRGPRGGHIPGAINVSRELFFDPDGGFLPKEEIARRVAGFGLRADRPIIAYCNGGVAATVPLFHLHRLGYADLSIYDGSWNEWGARPDLPIEG